MLKSVIQFQDTGTADEDEEWSGPNLSDFTDGNWADLSGEEKRRIAAHYTISRSGATPERFQDLWGPHHRPQTEGIGPAVWNGVDGGHGRHQRCTRHAGRDRK